ncbi:MAG TPA: hypothetical protein VMW52_03475 [Phycisphaerae bacterium]|nr:hypothetical protein [Phycisphaerae bacterium]
MSVQAWTGGDHYPGALAEVIAPPSLAWQAMTTATADNAVYDVNLDSTPSLQGAPWLLLLPTSTLTILQSTGGNTGDFTISSVPEAGEMRLSTDPGNGTAVKARVTPAGRNGLHDLAKRL